MFQTFVVILQRILKNYRRLPTRFRTEQASHSVKKTSAGVR